MVLPLSEFGVPLWLLVSIAALFGAIVGSFLNVVIYRLHTGRSLAGRSHCLSCGAPLSAHHLIPLLSYLALRGRCAFCGARFTPRYFLVELFTAVLFALVVATATDVVSAALLLPVMALLVVTVVYDIRHLIIPDECVLALLGLATLIVGYRAFGGGVFAWESLLLDFLAALMTMAFFFALWWSSGGRWIGFGDVKLAGPLALLVGDSGAFSLVVLSFWVGAGVSLFLMAAAALAVRLRGKISLPFPALPLTMKSAVPFAPFLIAGCLLVLFFGLDVLTLLSYDSFVLPSF